MSIKSPGSTWKKWDLHVHIPESLVNNYPGEQDVSCDAFLANLGALPPEFKVIGINDYVFVEGYTPIIGWRHYDDHRLAPLRRSTAGAYAPIINWLLYGDP